MNSGRTAVAVGWLLCSWLALGCGGGTTTTTPYPPGKTDTASVDTPVVSDNGPAVDYAADFDQADTLATLPGDGHADVLKDAAVAEVFAHETSDAEIQPDVFVGPLPCKSNEECQSLLVPGTPCLEAVCVDGVCETEASPDDAPCDAGNKCQVDATCIDGECHGSTLDCDDDNPCTDDSCEEAVGCIHAANQVPCDDNDLCTKADQCADGSCQSGNPVVCDDSNPCTTDVCLPESGCSYEGNAQPCDDGNACTTGDACSSGACVGSAVNCDDSNPCTDDTCDAKLGCKVTANTAPCDDDNPCTIGDACKNGQCAPGSTKTCATDGGCAVGACSPVDGKCKFADAADGTLCDDGNACSEADACKNGLCVGKPVACDDASPCTADACDPKAGCTHIAAGGSCDLDDNACTADQCVDGTCTAGAGKACDDGNPCTADKCDVKTGQCAYDDSAFEGMGCDADGSLCTVGDLCKIGQCAAGKVLNCDDGNVCTDDACDAKAGCTHKANTASCDADGSACTLGDACKAGVCVAGSKKTCDDFNPCTNDACDPGTGFCTSVNNTAACDDGDPCTNGDACTGGVCHGSTAECDPCVQYGGTKATVVTGHLRLCTSFVKGGTWDADKILGGWSVCTLSDMLAWSPDKSLKDVVGIAEDVWTATACINCDYWDATTKGHRYYSGDVGWTLLDDEAIYSCGCDTSDSMRFFVCHP